MCCIRVNFELLNYGWIVGYIYIHCYEYWFVIPGCRFYSYISSDVDVGTGLYLGRAPRTNETLPDFLKWCRVTRHPLVFHGLTGSQRSPGFGASH